MKIRLDDPPNQGPVVYVLMPTAGKPHARETIDKWFARGYRIALWQDPGAPILPHHVLIQEDYPGVWRAANVLAREVLQTHPSTAFDGTPVLATVCVFAGDDMDPDMNFTAQEIAAQYLERFPDGFGVMQPCGDPQGEVIDGKHNAARICGSAWFGLGWAARSYGGLGPTDGRYHHFYGDESLYVVSGALGVRWMRDDLTQWHRHWSFEGGLPRQPYHERTSLQHWDTDQRVYMESKAAGFPEGCPRGMGGYEYRVKMEAYRASDRRA